jgi:hypothetical protein
VVLWLISAPETEERAESHCGGKGWETRNMVPVVIQLSFWIRKALLASRKKILWESFLESSKGIFASYSVGVFRHPAQWRCPLNIKNTMISISSMGHGI